MAVERLSTKEQTLVPLGKVAKNYDSKRVPLSSRERQIRRGPYPYYGAAGQIDAVDAYLFDGLYLLVGEDGSVVRPDGRPFLQLVSGRFWVNNHAHVLRGDDDVETKYLYYALETCNVSSLVTGAVQPKITQANLNSVRIPYPSRDQRKRVVDVLGALDDKIEVNRRMNATLEAMARALFQSWFVDFDPVRAKLDGRSPAGLDPATAALFPDHLEDTALGHTPKGWEVCSLDKTAQFLNGLALQKYPPGDGPTLPVIKIAQLRKGDSVGADRCSANLPPNYIAQDGDVLFSWSGSLEVELWCGGPGALNQHLFKVTSTEFPKWFYYLWTLYHLDEFRLIAADKATTMGHIQRGHLSAAKVLIPPRDLLAALTRSISPLIKQIIANRIQSRTLATLRDALVPKLLSGEIKPA